MRIQSTDNRERLWEDLRGATGEGHTSQALDAAARHYVQCRGDTAAVPTGTYAELLAAARDANGGLGPEQIADILDTDELPVDVSTTTIISVGHD
jgi:hypothetical protein